MLNIYFLGKPIIEYNDKGLEDKLGTKAIALVCLLALNEKRYLSREKIEGYLWPDSNTEAARYNLRYNLWLIKKNIGPDKKGQPFLYVDNYCCSINTDYEFNCDIIDIMKFKSSEDDSVKSILKLKKLFRGDLLEGCYFKKCDELNDLIIFERMKFEQHKVRILKRLVELYEKENNYDDCLQVMNEILEIEPYDEEMVLKTLNIYVKCGKPVTAITYYNSFSEILANSLGIFPSPKLRDKYNEIRLTLSESYDDSYNEVDTYISSSQKRDSSDLRIVSDCIKGIEYFWIADVVGKIVNSIGTDCINQLGEKELLDLGSIQADILSHCSKNIDVAYDYKREVMNVNIINAFIKLLTCVCNEYRLTIVILNSSEMDDISASTMNYLKRIKIEGLRLVEE